LDGLSFDSIGEAEANWVEREFEKRDMLEVVKAMNGHKASSPNGYSKAFFQACWAELKENIMKVLRDFHERGKFEKRLNSTFITLISKILLNHHLSQKLDLIKMINLIIELIF
jgi:hypothetical protein